MPDVSAPDSPLASPPTLPPALNALWQTLLADLSQIAAQHPDALLACSMGIEDTLLTHALMQLPQRLGIFMLDTGRLHAETLALAATIEQRYGIQIERVQPQAQAVQTYVETHGANAFYDSVALRQSCCDIRKVTPLRRVLTGRSAWITGQRREQAVTRTELPQSQWDEGFGLHKYNPLALWTTEDVWSVARALDVPSHPLHQRGYPSIGCEPCTRAVRPGEDLRAGRWWWEQRDSRECGLHVSTSAH